MGRKRKNIQLIFIINDKENKAINFISEHLTSKKSKAKIDFRKGESYGSTTLGGLIECQRYYKKDEYIFFDNCSFDKENRPNRKEFAGRLSENIKKESIGKALGVRCAFFRMKSYESKDINDLLNKYESDDEKNSRIGKVGEKTCPPVSFMNFGKTIILNKCFIDSRYTIFRNNISHEVINCFKTDSDERYFYLCSPGTLNKEYFDRVGEKTFPFRYLDTSKILYLDYSKNGKSDDKKTQYVFLRKVKGIDLFEGAFDTSINREKYKNINYNGINICDIFGGNSYFRNESKDSLEKKEANEKTDVKAYATFKAKDIGKIFKPKDVHEAIVLPGDELNDFLKGSTMRHFVIEGSTFYENLITKIKKIGWEKEVVPTLNNYTKGDLKIDSTPDSIIEIIEKEHNELFYSDMLAYVFAKSPEILNFLLNKLKINKNVDEGYYDVERESKNIDILIKNKKENNKFVIVIENKIKASINCDEKKEWDSFADEKTRNKEIIEEVNKEMLEYRKINHNKKINQLSKYYLLAKYISKFNKTNKSFECILLCPESDVGFYDSEKENAVYGEDYKVCSYKLIFNVIDETIKNAQNNLSDEEKQIILQIKNCLTPHINKINNFYISRNRSRFYKKSVELLGKKPLDTI